MGPGVKPLWPTTKSLGSGLGVPFARKICEIHGGTLEFKLAPEGGTLATIRLPKSTETVTAQRATARQGAAAGLLAAG